MVSHSNNYTMQRNHCANYCIVLITASVSAAFINCIFSCFYGYQSYFLAISALCFCYDLSNENVYKLFKNFIIVFKNFIIFSRIFKQFSKNLSSFQEILERILAHFSRILYLGLEESLFRTGVGNLLVNDTTVNLLNSYSSISNTEYTCTGVLTLQKIFIPFPQRVFWLESSPPPPPPLEIVFQKISIPLLWKFQFCFTLSFKNLAFEPPPPPPRPPRWNFQ